MAVAYIAKFCIEMKITEISKLESTWSPEISIHGIPWKVKVCKEGKDAQQSLDVYLFCANKDKSPNWSLSGAPSFKLLPFGDDANPIEYHVPPYVFDASGLGYGKLSFIKWNDSFDQDKKYVKDDSINLEVTVTAEDPNDPHRSRFNFECVHKCCDNSYFARFTVTNIMNLMAVRSPNFTLRGLPWVIQITKTRSSHLGVLLKLNKDAGKEPSKMTMTIKLVSSKKDAQPIEKCDTKQYEYCKNLIAVGVVSWDEMVKRENGFVNNDSITLEVEIKANEPEDDMPNAKRSKLNPENDVKTPQMECPICFKCVANQDLSVTPCGHLFCLPCITDAIKGRAICPSCNKAVRLNSLRQLYLPVVN